MPTVFPPTSRRHSLDRCGDPYSTLGEKGGFDGSSSVNIFSNLETTEFGFFSKQGPFERTKGNHTIIPKPNQIISRGFLKGIFAHNSFHIPLPPSFLRKRTQSACHGRQPFHRTPARLLSDALFVYLGRLIFLLKATWKMKMVGFDCQPFTRFY